MTSGFRVVQVDSGSSDVSVRCRSVAKARWLRAAGGLQIWQNGIRTRLPEPDSRGLDAYTPSNGTPALFHRRSRRAHSQNKERPHSWPSKFV